MIHWLESSQSGILSDSCLFGWLCLMNLITRVFIHTLSDSSTDYVFLLISDGSTRHMATIRLFMMWMELQKADGFRPKVSHIGVRSSSVHGI